MTIEAGTPVKRDDVSALILAAGQGTRFGGSEAFLECGGTTILERVVDRVAELAAEIVVGVSKNYFDRMTPIRRGQGVLPVDGGETRQATVEALVARSTRTIILLHEVARPLASSAHFSAVVEAAGKDGAAACCVPVSLRDSIVMADEGFMASALPRDRVVTLQTPQAFRRDWLVNALSRLAAAAREKALSVPPLLLQAGYRVRLVAGSADNLKITFPEGTSYARKSPAQTRCSGSRRTTSRDTQATISMTARAIAESDNELPVNEPPDEDSAKLDGLERFLVLLFLRRYVTWRARRRRFAAMQGAACL